MAMIKGIVAVAKNFVIGKDGRLPWHYPADLKFFKQATTNNAIVMGFNTWQSLGKPLPNRLNIVLSRRAQNESAANVVFLRNKEQVLSLGKYLARDLYIIGGAKTYATFADVIEQWLVTEVPIEVEGADTSMAADFLANFTDVESTELDGGLIVRTFNRKSV